MTQRVAIVTGASSGIGKEAAKALAAQGWRVIAIGRDPARSAAAGAEIAAAAQGAGDGGAETEMLVANLSRMAEVGRVADQIAARVDRIDVLINNAGGMSKNRIETEEGLEENFAGNHLGPFLLTNRLVPLLRAAAADSAPGAVRIVNVSSDASEMIPALKWGDLQLAEGFSTGRAYCQAKLANVMIARGLAKRLAADGIVAHAVHPGTIDSNFSSHAEDSTQAHIRTLAKISAAQGAEALVWLATGREPGETSGGYYHQHKPMPANPLADDDDAIERLWRESEDIIATAGAPA